PADADKLSFTAYHTIPVRHGLTVGELAKLYNDERRIGCELRVIKMENWQRSMWFDSTGQTWVNPSPNMRSLTEAALYPGGALLRLFSSDWKIDGYSHLLANGEALERLKRGDSAEEIRQSWNTGLEKFRHVRDSILIYK